MNLLTITLYHSHRHDSVCRILVVEPVLYSQYTHTLLICLIILNYTDIIVALGSPFFNIVLYLLLCFVNQLTDLLLILPVVLSANIISD